MLSQPLDTIIVENNKRDLDRLIRRLNTYEGKFNISHVNRYRDAVTMLLNKKFDLAIFDVYLDDTKDCYDLIEAVGTSSFKICAITSSKQKLPSGKVYSIQNPIWFPKIHTEERIIKFIKDLNERIDEINELDSPQQKFGISAIDHSHYPVIPENVHCVHSDDKITHFYYFDDIENNFKVKISNENLTSVLSRLNSGPEVFVQCHNRWIVNLNKIIRMSNEKYEGKKGDGVLYLPHDKCTKIPIGGEFKENLKAKFNLRQKAN